MTRVWLELKLYRFQVVTVVLRAVAASVLLAWSVAQIEAIGLPGECTDMNGAPAGVACPDEAVEAWSVARAGSRIMLLVLTILPWVIGILLGAAVVSQEIEHRTALLAWTIDPSRMRWLARKALLLGAITVLLLVVPVVLSMVLRAAQEPLLDPWASFDEYHARGPILVAHGLLAFATAVLLGAVIGRVLPTLVVAVGVAAVAGGLVWASFGYWGPTVRLPDEVGSDDTPAALVSRGFLLDDGRIVDEGDLPAIVPFPQDSQDYWRWIRRSTTQVYFGYTGDMYPGIALRETMVVTLVAIGLIGAAMLIVRRRRPY